MTPSMWINATHKPLTTVHRLAHTHTCAQARTRTGTHTHFHSFAYLPKCTCTLITHTDPRQRCEPECLPPSTTVSQDARRRAHLVACHFCKCTACRGQRDAGHIFQCYDRCADQAASNDSGDFTTLTGLCWL